MATETLSSGQARRGGRVNSAAAELRARLTRISLDARLAALAVLAFLGVTIWWLTQDTRVPDWDSAQHMLDSFIVHDAIANGSWTTPFTEFNTYPPLAHIVGALGVFIDGYRRAAVIFALNLVFVPVLALSCYGIGKLVAGTRAGLLAVVFALGTPMIVAESHEAYVDPMQAALVALSVWAILASRRFERWGIAALAGLASGLAMLTKETTPIFLAGLLVVVTARGGWRNWRGLIAYALMLGVVGAPWYVDHHSQLSQLVIAHTSAANEAEPNPLGGTYPALLSLKNLSWYLWDAANIQLFGALLLMFLVGLVAAVRRCAKRPWAAENLYPELLGGVFVAWAGMTWLTHKDPRYSLPGLVYLAVLGSAWIVGLRARARRVLTAALLVAVAGSFLGVAVGMGGSGYQLRIALPGADSHDNPLGERFLTLYSTNGWLRGKPEKDANVSALLSGLRRDGVTAVTFCCANPIDFNVIGLSVMTREAGLANPVNPLALRPRDVFLAAHGPEAGIAEPCQTLSDGIGIYPVLGNPIGTPFAQYRLICPGHKPEIYGYDANAPPPPGLHLSEASRRPG
ncbi:MAG TPA: glycosyltransferase family 39 protein [Solirubrobacteraceae bacterium]